MTRVGTKKAASVASQETDHDAELFVPEKIDLGEWTPVRLSLERFTQFTRWTVKTATMSAETLASASRGDLLDIMTTLLAAIDSDENEREIIQRIQTLFSIILDKPPRWVNENWDTVSALRCLETFMELERVGESIASAQRIFARIMGRMLITNRAAPSDDLSIVSAKNTDGLSEKS